MSPSIFSFKFKLKLTSENKDHGFSSLTTGNVWPRLSLVRKKELVPDSIRSLPTELYHHIFSLLPPGAKLYPLLFVNLGFHAEAERLLYTKISLEGDQVGWIPTSDQSVWEAPGERHIQRRILLFKMLARTPRLSRLVHSFNVSPFVRLGEWISFQNQATRYVYWHLLNLALRAMPNLEELTIASFCGQSEDMAVSRLPAILDGCSFRLRRLVLLEYPYNDFQILENDAIGGQLEELTVSRELDGNLNPNTALPRLLALETHGGWRTALQLMTADRALRALYLMGCGLDPSQGFITHLVEHIYPKLRSFRICVLTDFASMDLRLWSRAIPQIIAAFPSLIFFRIDYSSISDSHIAQAVRDATPALRTLIHLKKVVFCSGDISYDIVKSSYSWSTGTNLRVQSREIAQQLFRDIPQLEVVRVGFEDWSRVQMELRKQTTVFDNPDEWKDKAFWRLDRGTN